MTPDDAKAVSTVFSSIVSEPWFNRNWVTERELFKMITSIYREARCDTGSLLTICTERARSRFSF